MLMGGSVNREAGAVRCSAFLMYGLLFNNVIDYVVIVYVVVV